MSATSPKKETSTSKGNKPSPTKQPSAKSTKTTQTPSSKSPSKGGMGHSRLCGFGTTLWETSTATQHALQTGGDFDTTINNCSLFHISSALEHWMLQHQKGNKTHLINLTASSTGMINALFEDDTGTPFYLQITWLSDYIVTAATPYAFDALVADLDMAWIITSTDEDESPIIYNPENGRAFNVDDIYAMIDMTDEDQALEDARIAEVSGDIDEHYNGY